MNNNSLVYIFFLYWKWFFVKNIISCMWYITGWLWYYYLLYVTCKSSTIFHINFIFNFHGNDETSFNFLESNQLKFFTDSCFSQKFNWLLDIYFWLKKSDLGEKNCSDKEFSSYKKFYQYQFFYGVVEISHFQNRGQKAAGNTVG